LSRLREVVGSLFVALRSRFCRHFEVLQIDRKNLGVVCNRSEGRYIL
jgi:hypothetical protein